MENGIFGFEKVNAHLNWGFSLFFFIETDLNQSSFLFTISAREHSL